MSLRINTNVTSLAIRNAMTRNDHATERSQKNLASGSRLADPSADVAGAAISNQMQAEIRSMEAAKMNAEQATSFTAVAEGSLAEQTNLITRMRELAVQAASDNYSSVERGMMNKEYTELRSEIDRIAKTTRFGSQNLLDGTVKEFDFQVGTRSGVDSRITYKSDSNTTADGLGIDGNSVEDKSEARDSMDQLDKALAQISQSRARIGAVQSRIDSAQSTLGVQIENISAARSRIADADLAKEVSDARRGQILQQYQVAMLQQANELPGIALRLIG